MKIFLLHPSQHNAPVLSLKPDSSLLKDGKPFFIPDFMGTITYEAHVAVRICRLGKGIPERFAHRYYDAFTAAVSFTASDLLRQAQEQGLPWDVATGFDGSAIIGDWVGGNELPAFPIFRFEKNQQPVQEISPAPFSTAIDSAIAYISRFYTLKTGDILFLPSTSSPEVAQIDDHFEGFVQERKVLEFNCK